MSFRPKEEHIQILIEYMGNHRDFATGRLSAANAKSKYKEMWQDLTNKLNALGYGTRPVEKWQKTWTDYKGNLKRKAAEIRRYQEGTGGGPQSTKKFSDLELKVLDIMGPIFYEGCGAKEFGMQENTSDKISTDHKSDVEGVELIKPATSKKIPRREHNDDLSYSIEHDYQSSPSKTYKKKKLKKNANLNNIYAETIDTLKLIQETINTRLESLEHIVEQRLTFSEKTIAMGFESLHRQ